MQCCYIIVILRQLFALQQAKKGSVGEEDTLVDFPLLFLVEAKGVNETLMSFMTQEKPFILYKTSKTRAQTNEGVWLSKKEV